MSGARAVTPTSAEVLCVVVTRPQPQADEWVARLQDLGLLAGALPLLAIAAPVDAGPVRLAWQQLGQYALVMFVSPSAVDRFFALRPAALAWPPSLIAAGTRGSVVGRLEAGSWTDPDNGFVSQLRIVDATFGAG